MTLTERINEDLKAAMKGGDPLRLTTIRSIRASIIEFSKRGTGAAMTPEEETAILLAGAKKRKEAIEMFEKAGRMELVAQEQAELAIITGYLPKQLTREEAEAIVLRIIAEVGATDASGFSKVMPVAMKELKGRIDGKVVQELVKQKLGG